jgi:hypothetical protein
MIKEQGRPPSATAEQIIAAYEKSRNVAQVCRDLKSGSHRVYRILDKAGIDRPHRTDNYHPKKRDPDAIPENYVAAMAEYKNGVFMDDLRKRFSINFSQLYRWLSECGIPRRAPQRRPKISIRYCRECGAESPLGEMFCCDQHRRDYNDAAIAPGFVPPRRYRKENQDAEASSQAAPPSHGDRPRV